MEKTSGVDELVLFTNNFPYGSGESFLEAEIPYLSRRFARVHVLSANDRDPETRVLPDNVSATRAAFRLSTAEKIRALRYVAHPLFWEEVRFVRSVYGRSLSFQILKVMLTSLARAEMVKSWVNRWVRRSRAGRLYLYSYWANDCALGITMVEASSVAGRICRAHGGDVYHERHRGDYLPFRHRLFKCVDTVAFISDHGRRYTADKMRGDYSSFHVAKIGTVPARPHAWRPDYRSDDLVFASCSWMKPLKRLHLIVEALALVPDSYRVNWLHVGSGPLMSSTVELAERLFAHRPNISVEFVGHVPNGELTTLYAGRNVQLFVNVSESEGLPVSIMEAFSAGIPAVATDVGGVSELVDRASGFLLDPNCGGNDIKAALVRFLTLSDEEKVGMSSAAYERWRLLHNAATNYPAFIDRCFSPASGLENE